MLIPMDPVSLADFGDVRPATYWPEGREAGGYGEYLDDLLPGETEIVRLQLMSTLSDVISVRARRDGGVIRYRVVDEYEGDFFLPEGSSTEPLSQGQVILMLDGVNGGADGGLVLGLVKTCLYPGCDPDALRNFVEVRSDFYPTLGSHYETAIRRLVDTWEDQDQDDEFLYP